MAPKAAPAKTGSKGPSPGGSKDASKTASKTGSGQPSRRNSKDIAEAYPVGKKPVLSEEDQALMKATTEVLDKLIEKVGLIIKCDEPNEGQAAAWCVARAEKRHSASIDRDAATLLVDRIGANLTRLDTEINKLLAAAVGEPPRIDRKLVEEMVGRSREEEAWGAVADPEDAAEVEGSWAER